MTQEKIIKALVSFGLTKSDAEVYVFLAKRGPQKAKDIAKSLKMPKQTLYLAIRSLLRRGLLVSSLEHPARFSAIPFEKMLHLFAEAKMEEARRIEQSKDEILSDWRFVVTEEAEEANARFTVLEGRSTIYSKIEQMMLETKERLSFATTVPSLLRADQFGLFDHMFNNPPKSKIQFRFITNLPDQNANAAKTLAERRAVDNTSIEWRTPELGLTLIPRIVTRDGEEALFFVNPKTSTSYEKEDVCLWTNCKSLVQAFEIVFEELWSNSTDIKKKILEIETGKLTPRTGYITDPEAAKKKYYEALQLAKEEIIVKTSSDGLSRYWKNLPMLDEWAQRGVSLRILAPLVSDNLQAAQELSKYGSVKHMPAGYIETTIVDGKHLFQFTDRPENENRQQAEPCFENTFYTTEVEYVEKTKNMFNALWKNARPPSSTTLRSVLGFKSSGVNPLSGRPWLEDANATFKEIQGTTTEKEVLNKILNAKKLLPNGTSKDEKALFGSLAQAVIHPPDYFNLPEMRIFAWHIDEQSRLGSEDMLQIFLWLETPLGYSYLPVATIGNNPQGVKIRKKSLPLGNQIRPNHQLAKKEEVYVRIHGNTLLAGWTVPITLHPLPYKLPPACILFEAYGQLKTGMFTAKTAWGRTHTYEFNGFEAFVTFFHPISQYTGPGTDGLLYRDIILSSRLTE